MRTYKEYLIPETINHEELRYLVSIGSKVLVKTYHPLFFFEIICQLIPSDKKKLNQEFCPLLESDLIELKCGLLNMYYFKYFIN
jgi:hypothetical protein